MEAVHAYFSLACKSCFLVRQMSFFQICFLIISWWWRFEWEQLCAQHSMNEGWLNCWWQQPFRPWSKNVIQQFCSQVPTSLCSWQQTLIPGLAHCNAMQCSVIQHLCSQLSTFQVLMTALKALVAHCYTTLLLSSTNICLPGTLYRSAVASY